tara:strand:+ start:136 stop:531 length:396 start_codon:yes stop_codon:yes gene_type:complete
MSLKEGDKFTHEFKITSEITDLFIKLSQDRNPLHIDDNFSISKGFKSKVVHGNIQNCFLSYFVGEIFPIKNVVILSQKIKFKNPVYENETLFFESKIVNFVESIKVYELKYKFSNSYNTVSQGIIMIKVIL